MSAKQVNRFKIRDYLASKGIHPFRINGSDLFYLSPYRDENTASFKVCNIKNLWIDYGDANSGGTLIDLVLKMSPNMCVSEVIKEITMVSGESFSFHQPAVQLPSNTEVDLPENLITKEPRKIRIYKTKELGSNEAITTYLYSRGISIKTAQRYCKEVYFSIDKKYYFGLGNQHEKGWAIRNKYWKGCSAQGISTWLDGHKQIIVFEGIFDMLSFLEIQKRTTVNKDIMVLNSLINLNIAVPLLKQYLKVVLMLDWDESGREAADFLSKSVACIDMSDYYKGYKDMNEYLMASPLKYSC